MVSDGVMQTVAIYNAENDVGDRFEWSKDTPLVWIGMHSYHDVNLFKVKENIMQKEGCSEFKMQPISIYKTLMA